jgi:O-succinylbenzoic acid--CoA ligase
LQRRWGHPWLLGAEILPIWSTIDEISQKLAAYQANLCSTPLNVPITAILVAETDPVRCLAALLAGLRTGFSVALANPRWGQREWQQVDDVLQPDRSQPLVPDWELYAAKLPPTETPDLSTPELLITTGGTGGSIKFARHTWNTLMASVQGFQAHFQVDVVNAYCVLPLYHVSGLMQALRTLVSGGQLILQPYAELKQGKPLSLPAENPGFLSLVPTQLQELLNQGDAYLPWLRQFQAILLGGAPPWQALLSQSRNLALPLAPTYGMTETASQVATLHPAEFLAGQTGSGRALPHATLHILNDQGQPQPPNQPGRLAITTPSLCKGYLSHPSPTPDSRLPTPPSPFLTDDIGYLDEQGYLHLLGRHSTTLITGGEKVQPEELEGLLLTADLVQSVCVVGLPDAHWGQAVGALVVPKAQVSLAQLADWLAPQVVSYKRPKHWIAVNALPQTAQGKVDRRAALGLAAILLHGYAL